jgi:hypothetical protein
MPGAKMNNIPVPQIIIQAIRLDPGVISYLSEDALKVVKAAGYDGIRTVMHAAVFGSVFGYLSGGSLSDARDRMSLAVSRAYVETADIAYVDGGGDLPLDDETAAWARGQIDAQFSYIDELFDHLKEIRKAGDFDAGELASARAEGYSRSLDSFFVEAKMRGSNNVTLEFGGRSGKESCPECQRLMGKRHKISYILAHNLVPHPGNTVFTCLGYRCEHYWFNPKTGEKFTP